MFKDTIQNPLRISNPFVGSHSDSNTNIAIIQPSANPEKWTYNYRVWRTRTATALLDYGLTKEAFAFNGCFEHPVSWISSKTNPLPSDAATVWMCSDNAAHDAALFMPTCDLRICPDCAARHTARLAARYIPKALELSARGGRFHLRHIVFTTPIALTSGTPKQINAKIKRYSDLPRKAMELVRTYGDLHGKSYQTEGAIQSFEFGADGLKLHFHVIQYGDYLPQKQLSEAWSLVTLNEASVVNINAIKTDENRSLESAIIETLKYSVKFWKVNTLTNEYEYLEPSVMPHLLLSLKGIRRVKSWGCFYKLPQPEKTPLCCEECSAAMVRFGVENWYLWIEQGVTKEHLDALKERQSLLHLKLANKSKKSQLADSKDPPDLIEKYRQKDLFKPLSHSHYHYEDNL